METVDYRPHARASGVNAKHTSKHGSDNAPYARASGVNAEYA